MTDLVEVLELVNRARTALGDDPLESLPSGRPRSNSDCVLARTLGVSFGNRTAWATAGRRRDRRAVATLLAEAWETRRDVLDKRVVRLPALLREFVGAFDAGEFPELMDTRSRSAAAEAGPVVVDAGASVADVGSTFVDDAERAVADAMAGLDAELDRLEEPVPTA